MSLILKPIKKDSNTTLVKVKSATIYPFENFNGYSNTTLVKVKSNFFMYPARFVFYSNTTLVKVKLGN